MSTPADFDGVVVAAPAWVDVPQLSVPCIARGGADGTMNAQAVALVARTNYLAELIGAGGSGNSLHSGSGAPDDSLGANGDFYIDITATALYGPKSADAWPAGISLVGPPGGGGFTTVQRYDIAGTFYWTVPFGVTRARFRAWGGGEGGEGNPGTTPTTFGRGGAGGGYAEFIRDVTPGQVWTIVVGHGGTFGNSAGASPGPGGDSSVSPPTGFGAGMTAGGGGSHNGGSASGGDINLTGEASRMGAVFSSTLYPANGSSSPMGGVGGTGNAYSGGETGHAPGGGGGGGSNGNGGGPGGPGMVEIWY
jgi:hypothetical protein